MAYIYVPEDAEAADLIVLMRNKHLFEIRTVCDCDSASDKTLHCTFYRGKLTIDNIRALCCDNCGTRSTFSDDSLKNLVLHLYACAREYDD